MKKLQRIFIFILTVVIFTTTAVPYAFAKDFAPKFDTNIGVQTQYAYSENNISWLRKLVIKEDMLSVQGIMTQAELNPVTSYPYITDAAHFKAEVEESIKNYTLDEESQRAAYLYLLQQIGALTIISEPTVSDKTKADWLRDNGIVITPEDEKDPERVLMISALYAMMRNDLYYVYKGEHLEIAKGTTLEAALIYYIKALSGNSASLTAFMLRFFGGDKILTLEDYIYYTSLMSLYVNGYVSVSEVRSLERKEVFRRVAIMTIRQYGLSIDSENATQQELTDKYLTAMLGTQYNVSLDPSSLLKSQKKQTIPYYILQRMAKQDANITISHTKYNYDQCFDIVLRKTDRFDLEKDFYSDIYEYDVYLKAVRTNISISPTPLDGTSSITINGQTALSGKYTVVNLEQKAKQTINIVSTYVVKNKKTVSTYKINIHQGVEEPSDSNITGIVPTLGTTENQGGSNSAGGTPSLNIQGSLPAMSPIVSNVNNAAMGVVGNVLSVNDKGQLVDQNNNIISQGNYEKLPEGYKYVVDDNGIIQVVFAADTTEGESASTGEKKVVEEDIKKIVIIASLALCILLASALIVVLIVSKKKGKKSDAEKVKARRAKEKAKKAKKEAKESKKKKK